MTWREMKCLRWLGIAAHTLGGGYTERLALSNVPLAAQGCGNVSQIFYSRDFCVVEGCDWFALGGSRTNPMRLEKQNVLLRGEGFRDTR